MTNLNDQTARAEIEKAKQLLELLLATSLEVLAPATIMRSVNQAQGYLLDAESLLYDNRHLSRPQFEVEPPA